MPDIFISYTRADRPRARLLADRFEAEGWSVWWDAELDPGDTWSDRIEAELAAARCVVVLWSAASVAPEKRWVRNEARDGQDRGLLVPAMLDAVLLPVEFRGQQAADLIGWQGQRAHAGLLQLLRAVALKLGRQVQTATWPRADLQPGGAPVGDADLTAATWRIGVDERAMGTAFVLRGCGLLVTDANVHAGALAAWRADLRAGALQLQATPWDGGLPRLDATPSLPPEMAQDVVVLEPLRSSHPGGSTSAIGLSDAVPMVGEPVRAVVALGDRRGVHHGRIVAVDAAQAIAGVPGGDAMVDGLVTVDIPTAPGASGAPMVRADGSLVGVLVAGDAGSCLCTPAARLLQRLRTAGLVA